MQTAYVKTAAAEKCISLAEAKAHLSFEEDVDYDEADITRRIDEAQADAERECGRVFVESTCALVLDDFPRDGEPIRLPFGVCGAVEGITYYDADGANQTVDPSTYHVALAGEPARIVAKSGQTWPVTEEGRPESVEVQYLAGWGSPEFVPPDLKAAVKLILGDRWSNRGEDPDSTAIPPAAKRILLANRAHEVG